MMFNQVENVNHLHQYNKHRDKFYFQFLGESKWHNKMLYEVEHHIVHKSTLKPLEKNMAQIPLLCKKKCKCIQYFLNKGDTVSKKGSLSDSLCNPFNILGENAILK